MLLGSPSTVVTLQFIRLPVTGRSSRTHGKRMRKEKSKNSKRGGRRWRRNAASARDDPSEAKCEPHLVNRPSVGDGAGEQQLQIQLIADPAAT